MTALPPVLIERLKTARRVVAFTGAGISAESGIPTFRGADGLWKKFKPEELASFNAFIRNPSLVWEWYSYRRTIIRDAAPNAGHVALADLESVFDEVTVVTQNVDNLHRRAGSRRVIELHGNIERNYCIACGARYDMADIPVRDGVPHCERPMKGPRVCDGLIRPDVVWFGELLPEEEWADGLRAIRTCDLLLCIGTSGVVYPAASLPLAGRETGAFLVEVNPEATPITDACDLVLRGSSAEILPSLVAAGRALHPSQRTTDTTAS